VKFILEELKKNKTITMDDLLVKLKEKYRAYNRDTTYVKKTSRMTRKHKNYKV